MMREGYEDLFSEHEPSQLLRELNGNVLWQYLPMNPNDERKPVSSVAPFHAAAEIELLRAENERLSQRVQLLERVGKRTSLRYDDLENRKEELREENEQFRKVLRSIACTDADCSAVKPFECPIDNCIHGKARAALGEVK